MPHTLYLCDNNFVSASIESLKKPDCTTRSNNWIENQIKPIALGRNNWLFAGSLRAG